MTELPFEYRLCLNSETPSKPVGNWFTKKYVAPADYDKVHVNNRVSFWSESDAQDAGFAPCAKDSTGGYDSTCFAAGCPSNNQDRRADAPVRRLGMSGDFMSTLHKVGSVLTSSTCEARSGLRVQVWYPDLHP